MQPPQLKSVSSMTPLTSAVGRTVCTAASITCARSTGWKSSLSFPEMMRETSSRSSKLRLHARVSLDHRQRVLDLLFVRMPAEKQLGPSQDCVQRRAQLVRDGGEKIVFQAIRS